MERPITDTYRLFLAGREAMDASGLTAEIRTNRAFYAGRQWEGVNSGGLPTPVFNIIARIADYLASSVLDHDVSLRYSAIHEDGGRSFADAAADVLNAAAAECWETQKMDSQLREGLIDAALCGTVVFYSRWDPAAPFPGGGLVTQRLDPLCLIPCDPSLSETEEQQYLLLTGREPVERLRLEARRRGLETREILDILPDDDGKYEGAGTETVDGKLRFRPGPKPDGGAPPPPSPVCAVVTRLWKDADGVVRWERATKHTVLSRGSTGLRRYPVALLRWTPRAGCFFGASPVTPVIGNQKYINKAYAMAMKHMTDSAFSKVIYDRRLIPEWTNEVGQAIGVSSGGDVSNAVKVVGCGELTPNFTGILEQVIGETKEMLGATETAVGEGHLANTSAIIALQEASAVPLELVRQRLYQCVEDVARNWAELFCLCAPASRLGRGCDPALLRAAMITPRVDVGAASRYSQILRVSTLDRLLDGGHITMAQYLRRLPDGVISDREGLLREIEGTDAAASAEGR